ncbi:MAG TPA: FAD-binding and (Fe-S)-binding domain-containing protein [Patescibacteria group bacterium]|nr:FAD-binding and (Fe-S)-binding domain-containing protein [Patescibacteria group bacterium]
MIKSLFEIFPKERVKSRALDRIAFASDASFYRLIPQAVVQPNSIEEIQKLFAWSHEQKIPLTFRAAGTSLSGQAITDGILVDISKHFKKIEAIENGIKVLLQPGIIGAKANAFLKPFKRKIGPDPASINTCMIGGILANNASGMCCGVALNSYHTLVSLKAVLPNGAVIDTAGNDANEVLKRSAPQIYNELLKIREEILLKPELHEKIRTKYSIKNTLGYSLNSFLDFENPAEILAHLLIGSEGTLGFIAEAVLQTIPDLPVKYTGLLFFRSVHAACAAIGLLKDSGAEALELLDRASLKSVELQPGIPEIVRTLPEKAAAILVEYQCDNDAELDILKRRAANAFKSCDLLESPEFTTDYKEQAKLWTVRKGLLTSVGAVRAKKTTVIIEDVAFPVTVLAEAVEELRRLFKKHDYPNAIIFGHAKDGNLHFVITQSFETPEKIAQYEHFMADLAEIVVRLNGSLKAEHGTGRNMAPFVENEWGSELYAIMRRIKAAFDPQNLLNPGVIINDDPRAHVTDLKSFPVVEAEVDKCIECGFCEPHCPSRNITTTPRQRIVLRREMMRTNDDAFLKELREQYQYDGMDTCAADGMCATACPVGINTGELIKKMRSNEHSNFAEKNAVRVAESFKTAEGLAEAGLRAGNFVEKMIGSGGVIALSKVFKSVFKDSPEWNRWMSGPVDFEEVLKGNTLKTTSADNGRVRTRRNDETEHSEVTANETFSQMRGKEILVKSDNADEVLQEKFLKEFVYFPTCVVRMFGQPKDSAGNSIPELMLSLAQRADMEMHIADGFKNVCCGQPFESKGFREAFAVSANRAIELLWNASREGALPVVIDASSCTYSFKTCRDVLKSENQQKYDALKIMDFVEFAFKNLLPRLRFKKVFKSIALHPPCSLVKMGLSEMFLKTLEQCGERVEIPQAWGCCGMAGDRGLIHPELVYSATKPESDEVILKDFEAFCSSNVTCEIGMSMGTDRQYSSFLQLLEKASG